MFKTGFVKKSLKKNSLGANPRPTQSQHSWIQYHDTNSHQAPDDFVFPCLSIHLPGFCSSQSSQIQVLHTSRPPGAWLLPPQTHEPLTHCLKSSSNTPTLHDAGLQNKHGNGLCFQPVTWVEVHLIPRSGKRTELLFSQWVRVPLQHTEHKPNTTANPSMFTSGNMNMLQGQWLRGV